MIPLSPLSYMRLLVSLLALYTNRIRHPQRFCLSTVLILGVGAGKNED